MQKAHTRQGAGSAGRAVEPSDQFTRLSPAASAERCPLDLDVHKRQLDVHNPTCGGRSSRIFHVPEVMKAQRPRARRFPRQEFTTLEIGVLIAVFRLEGLGHGVAVHDELEGFIGKPISTAAVYYALKRLERQSLLRTTVSGPLAMPGGRSRRLYELTRIGHILLKGEQLEAARLWQALPARFARIIAQLDRERVQTPH